MLALQRHLEIWQQYGGYICGVQSIARSIPDVTIDRLLAAMRSQNYMGARRKHYPCRIQQK